ncbi:MAG: glycosyltransferase family 2 protein [Rhodopirellula sp.]|nr:glycosyltransferase family 2 protein [Rhodopirellula sp.]
MTEFLFWLSLAGLVYIYLGYPLLVKGLARLFPMRRERHPVEQKVSIVIACHNESERIRTKLAELFQSTQSCLIDEVLIGSDGSNDDIAASVSALNNSRVRLVEFPERRGKPAVLNDLVPQCRNEIVVLCDARQILSDDAIPELLANFADPKVGVVSGELMFRRSSSDSAAGRGIGAYWRYEKMIRRAEGQFRSVPGATGALYAIRRKAFQPIPESTLLDDVVIPMIAVTQGWHCVFERKAIAWDDPSSSLGREAIRKRRTIAGAAQLIVHHPSWLLPWKNPIWLEFMSHKILRLVSPALLVIVAVTNVLLLGQLPYSLLLLGQICFYYSAFAGWICQKIGRPSSIFGIQAMFFTLNVTTVAALFDAVRGRFRVTWQRT